MAEDNKPAESKKNTSESEKTVKDVVNSMTEEQRNVMYALIGAAMESESEDVEPNKNNEEEPEMIKHNVFDQNAPTQTEDILSHDAMATIIDDAKKGRLTLNEAT